jgi:hypothetical protein
MENLTDKELQRLYIDLYKKYEECEDYTKLGYFQYHFFKIRDYVAE